MVSLSTNIQKGVQNLRISPELAGQRLDNFLINHLKKIPKTRIYRMLRQGEVRVNKHRAKPQYRLIVADIIRIPPIYEAPAAAPQLLSGINHLAEYIETQILYEDSHLLILNKPTGLAVHGGSGLSFGAIEVLRHLKGSTVPLELVHRLDRDTSGCLLVAKRRSLLKALHEAFQAGKVYKSYLALVKGEWQGGSQVSEPLMRYHLQSGERMVKVAHQGKASLTQFEVLHSYGSTTLMLAKPRTGRTHQIRVHTAFVGNSIVGDLKYGDERLNAAFKAQGFSRLFLHASHIAFQLPGESRMSQEAPCDAAWDRCLEALSKG